MSDGHVTTSIRGVISRVTTPGHLIFASRRPQRTFHPSVSFRVLSRAYPCSAVMVRGLGSARAIRPLPGAIPAVAARRALRAAVVVPVTFMFGDLVLHDANVWLFAALGSVTMLLFVEFDGSMRDRLRTHVAFVAATSPLVLAGTAVSRTVWPAAVVALLLSFVILFSGIISSVLAGAMAGLLISFLLAATVPGTMSVAPDRLVGWLIAGAGSLAAVAFVWPSATADPLGASAGSACRELAARLRPAARGMFAPVSTEPATAAVDALRRAFFNARYRPAGLSVVVGLLLWPRGAGGALRETAATGLLNTTRYLVAATRFALTRCDATASKPEPPRGERRRAVDAARRLDDGFRQFAAERGTKRVPVADIATIVTAVAALRRAADAICALWVDDDASGGERTAARLEILHLSQQVATWSDKVATGLLDLAAMPQPLAEDGVAIRRPIAAVLDDLTDGDGRVADTAVAMVWTMDHLQAVRRLQDELLPAAARAASTSNSTAPPRGGGPTFSLHSKTARRLARRRGASYDHV